MHSPGEPINSGCFYNPDPLTNIRGTNKSMDIHCNAGVTTTHMVGYLPGYGTVWYHPKGIANILSLACIEEHGYNVSYETNNGEGCFTVERPDGSQNKFIKSDRGLFYLNTDINSCASTVLITTVAENKVKYTTRNYNNAVLARKIQKIIGRPGTATSCLTAQ
jgi:hypothetical protein